MSPVLTSLPTSPLASTSATIRHAKTPRPGPAQSFSHHMQPGAPREAAKAVPAQRDEDFSRAATPRAYDATGTAADARHQFADAVSTMASDNQALEMSPAVPPDGQALDAARQADDRAFGFAELGLLGRGFVGYTSSTPAPIVAKGSSIQVAIPATPAAEAPVWLSAEAAAQPQSSLPARAARTNTPPDPEIRSYRANPVPGGSVAECEALLDQAELGAEETFGSGATATRKSSPRAPGGQASVLVARTDTALQVLVGAGRLTPDEEMTLGRRIEEVIAELGERLGEVQVNGRTLERSVPQGRQG